jgi:hypothetical protein
MTGKPHRPSSTDGILHFLSSSLSLFVVQPSRAIGSGCPSLSLALSGYVTARTVRRLIWPGQRVHKGRTSKER